MIGTDYLWRPILPFAEAQKIVDETVQDGSCLTAAIPQSRQVIGIEFLFILAGNDFSMELCQSLSGFKRGSFTDVQNFNAQNNF